MRFKLAIISLIALVFVCCRQTNKELLDNADGLRNNKKYNATIEIYTELLKRDSKLELALYNRGLCYIDIKAYPKALSDFDRIVKAKTIKDGAVVTFSASVLTGSEAKFEVSYFDALYQRAQVEFSMDSLKNSFYDFQDLIDNTYQRSNCLLWQGCIWVKKGKKGKACALFDKAKEVAINEEEKQEANEMIKTYCIDSTKY